MHRGWQPGLDMILWFSMLPQLGPSHQENLCAAAHAVLQLQEPQENPCAAVHAVLQLFRNSPVYTGKGQVTDKTLLPILVDRQSWLTMTHQHFISPWLTIGPEPVRPCRSHQASGANALLLHSLPALLDSPLPLCRTCRAYSNQRSPAVIPARVPLLQICRTRPELRAMMISCRHSN